MTHQPPSSEPRLATPASPAAGAAARDQPMPVLRSEEVLHGQRAVEILHAGVRYRLSVTSLGKLILTK